jgi:N-glycosylase/DNA lyase
MAEPAVRVSVVLTALAVAIGTTATQQKLTFAIALLCYAAELHTYRVNFHLPNRSVHENTSCFNDHPADFCY